MYSRQRGYDSDQHRPTDTADKIDFDGIGRIVDLVETLVRAVGGHPVGGRELAPSIEQDSGLSYAPPTAPVARRR